MIRKARIYTKFERAKMVAQPEQLDTGKLQHHRREFQVEIQNRFATLASIPPDDLDSRVDPTAKMIHEAAISIASRYKSEKPDKLSTSTKQLRGKRRQMKRNGTPTDNVEYSEICKAIRRKMKEAIRKHDEKQIIEAIENSKSSKQARQKQRLGKGQLISIMEEDGMHIHDQDRIVKRCVEFYEELYRSRRASADQNSHVDRTTTSSIDPPSILPLEVEAPIKRLKHNKGPGEDNITCGILQDGGDAMIQILTDPFNTCLHLQQVPKAWKNAPVVLIHKKVNTSDIKTTDQSACFALCTRCFQTFFYKG